MERKWYPRLLSVLSLVTFFIMQVEGWLPDLYRGALLGFGVLGIVIWIFNQGFKSPPPR